MNQTYTYNRTKELIILILGWALVITLLTLNYLGSLPTNNPVAQMPAAEVSGASIGTGTGLEGYYFNSMDFGAYKAERLDPTINFNWTTNVKPIAGLGTDHYSIRWLGQIQPQYSEEYTFYTLSDDGVRLFINNQLIIDAWVDQGRTQHAGKIRLNTGQKYDIKYEYYENTVGASVVLSWSSASQAKAVVPSTQLYPPSNVHPTPAPVPPPIVPPAPVPTPTPAPTPDLFGVNISGAEFGNAMPGTQNVDYQYPFADFQYFGEHNQKLIRIPFRWERVQHELLHPLSTPDINAIKNMLDIAAANNQKVILDLHNFGRYYGFELKKSDANNFADVWTRLALVFKNSSALYGYELMNEPHDLPEGTDAWSFLAQAATDAIRKVDTAHYVIVPGYDWQSCLRLAASNPNLNVKDPTGKLLYAAHDYFDLDQSGSYTNSYDAEQVSPYTGVDRLAPFVAWLKNKNARGIITEYGVPDNDSRYLATLDNFLSAIKNEPTLVGGTYWSAGPWWGDYPLSVEPNGSVDQSQMSVLIKY